MGKEVVIVVIAGCLSFRSHHTEVGWEILNDWRGKTHWNSDEIMRLNDNDFQTARNHHLHPTFHNPRFSQSNAALLDLVSILRLYTSACSYNLFCSCIGPDFKQHKTF